LKPILLHSLFHKIEHNFGRSYGQNLIHPPAQYFSPIEVGTLSRYKPELQIGLEVRDCEALEPIGELTFRKRGGFILST
jgi:hypothetical protein